MSGGPGPSHFICAGAARHRGQASACKVFCSHASNSVAFQTPSPRPSPRSSTEPSVCSEAPADKTGFQADHACIGAGGDQRPVRPSQLARSFLLEGLNANGFVLPDEAPTKSAWERGRRRDIQVYAVAMRRIDPSRNMARFYVVEIMPTLFGQWAVVRRWGRVNTDGRRSETWFDDLAPALSSAAEYPAAKCKRGYASIYGTPPSSTRACNRPLGSARLARVIGRATQ